MDTMYASSPMIVSLLFLVCRESSTVQSEHVSHFNRSSSILVTLGNHSTSATKTTTAIKPPLASQNFEHPNVSQSATPPPRQIIRPKHPLDSSSTKGQSRSTVVKRMCAPHLYSIELAYGGCVRRVVTKMCYGHCNSYTAPFKHHGTFKLKARCWCCTDSRIGKEQPSVRKFYVPCIIDDRPSKKVFKVPFVKNCKCRPCGF